MVWKNLMNESFFNVKNFSAWNRNYWHSLLKSVTEVAYYKLYFELRQIMWKLWPVNEISISCFEGAFECDMFWGFPCLSWQLLPAKQISLFSFFLKIFFNASMVIMCWNWFLFFFFFHLEMQKQKECIVSLVNTWVRISELGLETGMYLLGKFQSFISDN